MIFKGLRYQIDKKRKPKDKLNIVVKVEHR